MCICTFRTDMITNENLGICFRFRFRFRNGKSKQILSAFFFRAFAFVMSMFGSQATTRSHTYEEKLNLRDSLSLSLS